MNLHTSESVWKSTFLHPQSYPSLEEDVECDVVVIGSGESGSLISYKLTEQGVDTILVDKRASIAEGTSVANTGLLQFTNDKTLTSCMHTFGKEKGLRFYRLCKQAVDALEQISSKLVFSPDFIRRNSLYYASCPEDLPKLQEEYNTLKRYEFPVEYWDSKHISERFSFSKLGAIYASGDAEVNPHKLVHALVQTSRQRGLRVYTNTKVSGYTMEQGMLRMHAGRYSIRAKYAVYATGYETQEIKRNPNAVFSSSFAVATPPVPHFSGWFERCLLWETARPYLFIRTTADNRIVLGGLDESTAIPEERDRMLPRKKELLLEEARKLFPNIPDLSVEYGWSAAFCSTHDGLPMIGVQEQFSNSFFMLGYGGNGTVYSMIASQVISDWIISGSSSNSDLFRFDRVSHNSQQRTVPV
jgi:glycine/D-amino acid oxidase-like deaminating enzyme